MNNLKNITKIVNVKKVFTIERVALGIVARNDEVLKFRELLD